MGKIQNDLDRLADLRSALKGAQLFIDESVDPGLVAERDRLAGEVKDLEGEIKVTAAKLRSDHRHTFRGKLLQVVYTEKVSYPKAAIEEHVPPRYRKLCEKVSEVWSIRKAAAE